MGGILMMINIAGSMAGDRQSRFGATGKERSNVGQLCLNNLTMQRRNSGKYE